MFTDRAEAGLLTRVANILLLLIALVVLLICSEQGKSAIRVGNILFQGNSDEIASNNPAVADPGEIKPHLQRRATADASTRSSTRHGGLARGEAALLALPSRLIPSKRGRSASPILR
jgi:hypothetical protein